MPRWDGVRDALDPPVPSSTLESEAIPRSLTERLPVCSRREFWLLTEEASSRVVGRRGGSRGGAIAPEGVPVRGPPEASVRRARVPASCPDCRCRGEGGPACSPVEAARPSERGRVGVTPVDSVGAAGDSGSMDSSSAVTCVPAEAGRARDYPPTRLGDGFFRGRPVNSSKRFSGAPVKASKLRTGTSSSSEVQSSQSTVPATAPFSVAVLAPSCAADCSDLVPVGAAALTRGLEAVNCSEKVVAAASSEA